MTVPRWTDQTVPLLRQGYEFLPRRRERLGRDAVPLRFLGTRAWAVCGPQYVERFYEEEWVQRSGAVPEPVRSTLFGNGAIHTLDGPAHRARRELFLAQLAQDRLPGLVAEVTARWDAAAPRWERASEVVLFDEAARVLLDGVWRWTGLAQHAPAEPVSTAADMVAMVDGFASVGRRHLQARLARHRQEQRLARVIHRVRSQPPADEPTVLSACAWHTDELGEFLPARVAAVELLNIVRPTVAIAWFVAFAAHALHTWPDVRSAAASDDPALVTSLVNEIRRYYPFAPFVGGLARRPGVFDGVDVRPGDMLLLDLYGQDHHPDIWHRPNSFEPDRFVAHAPARDLLVPQGGGDPRWGHRCPGESATVALLTELLPRLARLRWTVAGDDLAIPLSRIPTRPREGVVLKDVRAA